MIPDHFGLLTEDQRAKHMQRYYANSNNSICYHQETRLLLCDEGGKNYS